MGRSSAEEEADAFIAGRKVSRGKKSHVMPRKGLVGSPPPPTKIYPLGQPRRASLGTLK